MKRVSICIIAIILLISAIGCGEVAILSALEITAEPSAEVAESSMSTAMPTAKPTVSPIGEPDETVKTPTSEPTPTEKTQTVYYWTKNGKKYHKEWCSTLKNSKSISSGTNPGNRTPCKVCNPDKIPLRNPSGTRYDEM